MKKGEVYKKTKYVGLIWEDSNGYHFQYDRTYLDNPILGEVSKTLPLRENIYSSDTMIPFFDGLIPEGWLLEIAVSYKKINSLDRMTLLLTLCGDNIGDVSIKRIK